MILYADCISHGSALAEYDSRNDTATLIKTWGMPSDIPSISMYERMMNHIAATSHVRRANHRSLKDTIIRIEASPTPEESKGWTEADWSQLAHRVLVAMDFAKLKRQYRNYRMTNLRDTMGAVYLHKDSKSGIFHLHFFMCRVDNDGHVNCGNHIGERALAAADVINHERGWVLPETIHDAHVKEVTFANGTKVDICYGILRDMNDFSITDYLDRIQAKGYGIRTRVSSGKIVGYTIMYGNSSLNASELSDKHSLTAANLERTWIRLHRMAPTQILKPKPQLTPAPKPQLHPTMLETPRMPEAPTTPEASQPVEDFVKRLISVDDTDYSVNIKRSVLDTLQSDIEEPLEDVAENTEDMLDMAVLMFAGYVDAATQIIPSYGGGGSNDLPRRRKDEDDEKWAHRCSNYIRSRCQRPRYHWHR